MGPFHGMSDRARAADALMKENIENIKLKIQQQTPQINHETQKLTCIDGKNIWIIDTINCQQIA